MITGIILNPKPKYLDSQQLHYVHMKQHELLLLNKNWSMEGHHFYWGYWEYYKQTLMVKILINREHLAFSGKVQDVCSPHQKLSHS